MMQLTPRRAAFGLRQLLDEFQLLVGYFPDLQDAFDADELPLAFILRRDSRLTDAGAEPSETFSPRPHNPARPRMMPSRTHSRDRHGKQLSDE
jgi:hypothetical protein